LLIGVFGKFELNLMEYMEGEVECREGVLFGEDCEIGGDCT
jgi:hypothetical protein